MDEPRFRDRLFFALACYASVLAWVAFSLVLSWFSPEGLDLRGRFTGGILILFFTLPVSGMVIGLGTGALLSRGGYGARGAILGLTLGILVVAATFMAWG